MAASLGFIGLGLGAQSWAACMGDKSPAPGITGGTVHLVDAVYRADGLQRAGLQRVSDEEDGPGIVGLWQFNFGGFLVDWGTEAFHSDGTEIIFSGGQNPQTGDVCQGVWRRTGPNTYTLNHIAMGWVAPGAAFGIRVHLHAIIHLHASGNSFSGTYKTAVYSVGPANPFDESVQVASGNGTITGTRVQPD